MPTVTRGSKQISPNAKKADLSSDESSYEGQKIATKTKRAPQNKKSEVDWVSKLSRLNLLSEFKSLSKEFEALEARSIKDQGKILTLTEKSMKVDSLQTQVTTLKKSLNERIASIQEKHQSEISKLNHIKETEFQALTNERDLLKVKLNSANEIKDALKKQLDEERKRNSNDHKHELTLQSKIDTLKMAEEKNQIR